MDIKARAAAIFEKHFKKWESNLDRMASGYNYESTYVDMMGKIEKEVLQISVGTVPKDKNLKKTPYQIWKNRIEQKAHTWHKPNYYKH